MKQRGRIIAFLLIVVLAFSLIGSTGTNIAKKVNLGLDLQGGFEILYEVTPVDKKESVDQRLLESTVQTLNDRVNRLGISEANIDIEGKDRIRVQLAGVENQEEARDMLATSANLSFRDVNDVELMSGADLKEGSARQDYAQNGAPNVTLKLKDADQFGEVTTQVKDMKTPGTEYPPNLLVIWMDYEEGEDTFAAEYLKTDPKFVSAPSVDETLNTNQVEINGPDFTVESAQQIAAIINSGSLPVHMEEIYSTSVGAQFGEQALNQTIFAGAIGVGLIFLFMIGFYRLPGLIAVINLCIYIYLIILIFQLMNGVLTLPGIAALILGVGMAIDANVITFERMKEELRTGRSVASSFQEGTKNSLSTILDANITTLLAAVILFAFGTSSVKGFATMLIVSVLISFITAVFGTRLLLGLWVHMKSIAKKTSLFGVRKSEIQNLHDSTEQALFLGKERRIISKRKMFFAISIVLVVLSIGTLVVNKLNPGIDFTSGSRIDLISEQKIEKAELEDTFSEIDLTAKSILISGEEKDTAVARFDQVLTKTEVQTLQNKLKDTYGTEPSVSVVSPIVGKELVKNALFAVGIALIGMIIYVTIRFEMYFAATSIVTLVQNVLITLGVFSLLQLEFDVTIVAAVLTIIGYTINDTIVIFDRIRENIRRAKRIDTYDQLKVVVNKSIVQSMTRSLNTSITTLFPVIIFIFLGAESIQGFAMAMGIGIIIGTFSSLFIGAPLWLVWRGRTIVKKPLVHEKKERVEGPQV